MAMPMQLIETPQPSAGGRCGSTQAEVQQERLRIETTLPPGGRASHGPACPPPPLGHRQSPRGDPHEERGPSCPRCDSQRLEFGFHFATHYQDLEGEMAHCLACDWSGEAEETQPPGPPQPLRAAAAHGADAAPGGVGAPAAWGEAP